MTDQVSTKKPPGVYIIAIYFTAIWLYSLGSFLYVLFIRFTPEMRQQALAVLKTTPVAFASIAISEMNGLLMLLGVWLLFAMRRIGVGLMLASTVLLGGLIVMSWPRLLGHLTSGSLHVLLLGGSSLVLQVAATIYAFRLDRRGLLR
jgi:hypothetical protein